MEFVQPNVFKIYGSCALHYFIVTMYHLAIDFDTIFKASLVHLQ